MVRLDLSPRGQILEDRMSFPSRARARLRQTTRPARRAVNWRHRQRKIHSTSANAKSIRRLWTPIDSPLEQKSIAPSSRTQCIESIAHASVGGRQRRRCVMRRMLRFWAVFPLFATPAIAVDAPDWIPIGPPGGVTDNVAVDPDAPDTVYATGIFRLFRSADGGRHWQQQPVAGALSIAVGTAGRVYVGGYQ